MKKVLKRLESRLIEIKGEQGYFGCGVKYHTNYVFEITDEIKGKGKLVVYLEQDEPESLTEFLDDNNLDKKELVQWLNKNYNK